MHEYSPLCFGSFHANVAKNNLTLKCVNVFWATLFYFRTNFTAELSDMRLHHAGQEVEFPMYFMYMI